ATAVTVGAAITMFAAASVNPDGLTKSLTVSVTCQPFASPGSATTLNGGTRRAVSCGEPLSVRLENCRPSRSVLSVGPTVSGAGAARAGTTTAAAIIAAETAKVAPRVAPVRGTRPMSCLAVPAGRARTGPGDPEPVLGDFSWSGRPG